MHLIRRVEQILTGLRPAFSRRAANENVCSYRMGHYIMYSDQAQLPVTLMQWD